VRFAKWIDNNKLKVNATEETEEHLLPRVGAAPGILTAGRAKTRPVKRRRNEEGTEMGAAQGVSWLAMRWFVGVDLWLQPS
jgi:hypothetical protein